MSFADYFEHLDSERDWYDARNADVKLLIPHFVEWFGDRDPVEQPFPIVWCECPRGHKVLRTQVDAFTVHHYPVLRFVDPDDPEGPALDVPEHPDGGPLVEAAEPREASSDRTGAAAASLRWTFRCPHPKHPKFRSVVRSDEAMRRYFLAAKLGLSGWRLP